MKIKKVVFLTGLITAVLLTALAHPSYATTAPEITAIAPAQGPTGKLVTITGRNFGGLAMSMNYDISIDFNRDDIIDDKDYSIFTSAYGTTRGDPRFDPRADLNGDGIIDIKDLVTFARR